jgi:N-carbamoyl-L-amino-acid hydrolase
MVENMPIINSERLKELLSGINKFGHDSETGGYNRPGFSAEDIKVRNWFADQMKSDGLQVSIDAAGNVFGRLGDAGKPCIMSGSHLDTVPQGGAFDGALGAAIALECARCLKENNIALEVPFVAVGTSEEEGRFGGMLGSQTMTGQLASGWLENATDPDGQRLIDAMKLHGFAPENLLGAAWPAGSIKAFLELHIEQGPVLDIKKLAIGVVEAIAGVLTLEVKLQGTANHSGTTPMDMRADAFAGLATIGCEIPKIIEAVGTQHSRITIGKVDIRPNFPHSVPGEAEFTINIRDISEKAMNDMRAAMEKAIAAAAKQHNLSFQISEHTNLSPVVLDAGIRSIIKREADGLGLPNQIMPSGAGHDSQTMQAFCPAGMIFVPSKNGISHAPAEWTEWEDIEKGAQLMLNTILRLSKEL